MKMETPELKKIAANNIKSQSIGEFLEWLQSKKHICFCITPGMHKHLLYESLNAGKMTENQYYETIEDIDKELKFGNEDFTYIPSPLNIEKTRAEYFGVDLIEAEKERQGLLDEICSNTKEEAKIQ